MQSLCLGTILSIFVILVVNGHVIQNNSVHNTSNNSTSSVNSISNSTDVDSDSNNTDTINSTTAEPLVVTQENRVFRLRERVHSRNRRFRLRRIREQILRSLGWTEPPSIPEDLRLQVFNGTFPNPPDEPAYTEDRRCFSASCYLPRQIDRHLWEDEALGGYRVYTGIMSRHELSRSTLQSASLNVFLTHIEGFTCHGEEVPVSRTGSRFLVSVYQFIRPLRYQRSRKRVLNRKRLIDARMVTTSGHTWVTFDVRQAVLEWINGGRHNFGFEIMVKDENETECNAANMFVPVDCNSPGETGCREDTSEPVINSIPWLQTNIDGNYPYLELVTRRYQTRGRERRHITDTSSAIRDVMSSSLATSRRTTVGVCQGRQHTVNLLRINDHVIAPREYTTLECGGRCATAHNGMLQIVASRCRPTVQQQIVGLYFDENLNIRFGPLNFTQVLQCGC